MLEVVENLAPNRLRRTDADGVGVLGRLVGQTRRMQAAQDNLRAAPLPSRGQLVGPAGRGDVGLDADQVHLPVHFRRFDVFVADDDLPALGRQAGDRQQAERRKFAST